MTPADDDARAAEVRALANVSNVAALDAAPLPDLLLLGLSDGDPDPVIGVLGAVRSDVDVLAVYATSDAAETDTVGQGLRSFGCRLDVALELLRRLRRGDRAAKDGAA